MEDQEKRIEEEVVDNTDYIAAIKELKQKSVSREKYDALQAEKQKLLDEIVNGQEVEKEEPKEELGTRLEYYKKYKENKFNSDLEYWDNLSKLRKATIKENGKDPCVTGNYGATGPNGEVIEPSPYEAEAVEHNFEVIDKMIEEANGDAKYFEMLLKSGMSKR